MSEAETMRAEQILKARRVLARLDGCTTYEQRVALLACELTDEHIAGLDRAQQIVVELAKAR